jgi:AcrR family transcriptional regulator
MITAESAVSLRDRQKEVTRDLILNAVARLMESVSLVDMTFVDIAMAAGVSERTVYRHFSTKDELLQVFWARVQQRLGAARARTGAAGPSAIWEGRSPPSRISIGMRR